MESNDGEGRVNQRMVEALDETTFEGGRHGDLGEFRHPFTGEDGLEVSEIFADET
jgi:hypothetical protein